MVCGAGRRERGLNMDALDHSEDEEDRSRHYGSSGGRFGARWQKPRSKSHHQLLLMDSVGNGGGVDGDGAKEDQEIVPLPEYERLSQSARLPDDPDPKNPLLPEYRVASPQPQPPPPPPPRPQKKPAAWRLIDYVRSRNRSSGCSSDGDSRSSDGEKEADDGGGGGGGDGEEGKKEDKDKKRSSWLPDKERRWPVQGFY